MNDINLKEVADNFMADYIGAVESDGLEAARNWADTRLAEITKTLDEEHCNALVALIAPKLNAFLNAEIKAADEACVSSETVSEEA